MIAFHTLYWNNISEDFVNAHKSVMSHFNIPINYTVGNYDHGAWMDHIMTNEVADIVVFFDIDCVPLSKEKVDECIDFVKRTDSFLGCVQASNHIPPFTHTFAAPSFFVISKKCWERIGRPSFKQGLTWDVAEKVSFVAEDQWQRYRCLYPDFYEREPIEGVWRLHNYGIYGVGCTFENTVYHLYQGRIPTNRDLFIQRCNEIVSGTFSTEGFHSCKDWNYKGRIVR